MARLSQSTIENLGYYVYLLINPRTGKVFYVGKGVGNRINHHLLDALEENTFETEKIRTIREIQNGGDEVKLVILRHGLSEKEAFEVEAAMIDFIGSSLTNIVTGHHGLDRGMMNLDEIKIKYEAEAAIFDEPVVLININKKYVRGMSAEDIYEATRSAWRVSITRVNNARIVCSVYKGIIREVFIVKGWFAHPDREGRSYFEGSVAPQVIRNKYIHKSVTKYWKQGSQSPIKYEG